MRSVYPVQIANVQALSPGVDAEADLLKCGH